MSRGSFVLFLVATFWSLLPVFGETGPNYEVGDKIEYNWGGKWNPGTITEIRDNGLMKVEFVKDGEPKALMLRENKLRTLERSGPRDFRAGDKVAVEMKNGNFLDATVVEVKGNGWIEVEYVIDGTTLTPAIPPERVKPVGAAAGTATAKPTELSSQEFRTWKSMQGTEIEARLVSYIGGSAEATLERRGGGRITVRLDQLSLGDRAYLTRALKAKGGGR